MAELLINQTRINQLSLNGADIGGLFDDFVKHVDVSPATLKTYTKSARQFMKFLAANGNTRPNNDDVINFKHALEKAGKSAATINLYLVALRAFFKWTSERGLFPNIMGNVKGKKIDRNFKKDPLSAEQAKAILDQDIKPRDRAMFELALTCGLRTIEIARANVEDMRNVQGRTVLYVQGKGRESKSEPVIIPAGVEKAIRAYLATRPDYDDNSPLFVSDANRNRGGRLTTKTISMAIKAIMVRAGYKSKRLTAHSLRHTAITLALEAGHTIQEVSAFARHNDLSTTLIYSHNLDALKSTCSCDVYSAVFGNSPLVL